MLREHSIQKHDTCIESRKNVSANLIPADNSCHRSHMRATDPIQVTCSTRILNNSHSQHSPTVNKKRFFLDDISMRINVQCSVFARRTRPHYVANNFRFHKMTPHKKKNKHRCHNAQRSIVQDDKKSQRAHTFAVIHRFMLIAAEPHTNAKPMNEIIHALNICCHLSHSKSDENNKRKK